MRIRRIGLDRWGHFTNGGLDFGDRRPADLHIVCGRN
ncbi:AAA family ATPase, partial [Acinetobacter baumannii]